MNISKAIIIIAIGLLVCRDAAAQTEAKPDKLPPSVMNAEIASVDGSSRFRLADHGGKVLVLYLWASWCGPCRVAAPAINDFKKDYAARGVEVIGLVVGDPRSEAEATLSFTQEFEHNFVSGWIDRATAKDVIGDKKIIPQILVTTGSGYLFTRMIGYNQEQTPRILRETVEEALANQYLIK